MITKGKATRRRSGDHTQAKATSPAIHGSNAKGQTETVRFTKFMKLPIEVRLMIWCAALPTREVALDPFLKYANERHVKAPPLLLQVNRECREETLKHQKDVLSMYKAIPDSLQPLNQFPNRFPGTFKQFVDPSRDIVFFDIHTLWYYDHYLRFKFVVEKNLDFTHKVQHLQIRGLYRPGLFDNYTMRHVRELLIHFPDLEELNLVNVAIGPKAEHYKEVHGDKWVKTLVEFFKEQRSANASFKTPRVSFDIVPRE